LQKYPNPFDPDLPAEVSKRIMLLQRYDVSERRAFHKGMEDLRRLQMSVGSGKKRRIECWNDALDELYLDTEDALNDSKPRRVSHPKSKASPGEVIGSVSAQLEKLAATFEPEAREALLGVLNPEKEASEPQV